MESDVRTLDEIAAHSSMLQVACSPCGRRGRYRLDDLIARGMAPRCKLKVFLAKPISAAALFVRPLVSARA